MIATAGGEHPGNYVITSQAATAVTGCRTTPSNR